MSGIVRRLKTSRNYFKLFDPIKPKSYNVLLTELLRDGLHYYVLQILASMRKSNLPLDSYSFCSCLLTSSHVNDLSLGKQLHAQVEKTGWLSSVFVGSALIDLYCKAKLVTYARMVFDEIPVRNTVCANALLSGYSDARQWDAMIQLARNMPAMNLQYDDCSLLVLLRTCGRLSAIKVGAQIHAFIIRNGYELHEDIFLQSSLIELYGKCGNVAHARRVFDLGGYGREGNGNKDLVLYSSMLGVYGRNGKFNEVIELFQNMLKEGIKPDGVAFVSIIAACGHTGEVSVGLRCFETMVGEYEIEPWAEHYSCIVNLLCKYGEMEKAWELVNQMIMKGKHNFSVSMWSALLSACEEHGNVELGQLAAREALKLQPDNAGVYMKLSSLYGRHRMSHEINLINNAMKEIGLKKDAGCSRVSP